MSCHIGYPNCTLSVCHSQGGCSEDVDAHVAARAQEGGADEREADGAPNESAHGVTPRAEGPGLVDRSDVVVGELWRADDRTSIKRLQRRKRLYVPISPASRYRSRRSFFVLEVTTTAPFAFAHARSTCSGATLRREAMLFTGASTGPPGWRVSGLHNTCFS